MFGRGETAGDGDAALLNPVQHLAGGKIFAVAGKTQQGVGIGDLAPLFLGRAHGHQLDPGRRGLQPGEAIGVVVDTDQDLARRPPALDHFARGLGAFHQSQLLGHGGEIAVGNRAC